jgi:hypothetical protein
VPDKHTAKLYLKHAKHQTGHPKTKIKFSVFIGEKRISLDFFEGTAQNRGD